MAAAQILKQDPPNEWFWDHCDQGSEGEIQGAGDPETRRRSSSPGEDLGQSDPSRAKVFSREEKEPWVCAGKLQHHKDSRFLQINLYDQNKSQQSFVELSKPLLKPEWKSKGPSVTKTVLTSREWEVGCYSARYQDTPWNSNSIGLVPGWIIGLREQNKEPRQRPTCMWKQCRPEMGLQISGEGIDFRESCWAQKNWKQVGKQKLAQACSWHRYL